MGNQLIPKLLKGADNTLEGGSNIREVSDATTNDENLSLGIWVYTGDEIN